MIQRLVIAATTVEPLTAPSTARTATITVEGSIRFFVDGSTPSATLGHLVGPGTALTLSGSELPLFRAYAAAEAILQVTYK